MSHRLTPKQLKALSMLAGGISTIDIAIELKLRRETMARWRKIPEFMYEYEKLMDEVRYGFRNKITEAINTSIERIAFEAGGSYGDPKRIEALLNVIKTLEKRCDNQQ
jgi:hypothetical protein